MRSASVPSSANIGFPLLWLPVESACKSANEAEVTDLPIVPQESLHQVLWMAGDVCDPFAEPTMSVNCSDPFREEFALSLLLLIIQALHLQHESLPVC
jgi:hypothetical protein